jgi:hypothetical protein
MALLDTPQRGAVTGGRGTYGLLGDTGTALTQRPRAGGTRNVLGLLDEKVIPYGQFSPSETYDISTYDPRQISSENLDYIMDLVNKAGRNLDPALLTEYLKSPGENGDTFAISAFDLEKALDYRYAVLSDEFGVAQQIVPWGIYNENPDIYGDLRAVESPTMAWARKETTLDEYGRPVYPDPSTFPVGYPEENPQGYFRDISAFDEYIGSLYPDIKELYKSGEVSTKTFDEYMKSISPTVSAVAKPTGTSL